MITVLMPVGPNYNPEWLKEAFDSAVNQTCPPNEILIVDDGANISVPMCYQMMNEPGYAVDMYYSPLYFEDCYKTSQLGGKSTWTFNSGLRFSYWRNPCNLGFTAAFNLGMALAENELVVYLAADDRLMPTAVERAVQTYLASDKKDAWYAFTYELSNSDVCAIPNNIAMITKGLWRKVGGYPPAGFVGPDALVLSCLIAHAPELIVKVDEGNPLYWIRDHPEQETKTHTWKYVDEMTSIRSKYTKDFKFKD